MTADREWIRNRFEEVRRAHASVADAAADRLLALLESEFADHQLSAADRVRIAKELIGDMARLGPQPMAKPDAD